MPTAPLSKPTRRLKLWPSAALLAALALLTSCGRSENAAPAAPKPPPLFATLETDKGTIEIELLPGDAPKTVENFRLLSERGYYNGLTFHRIVKGFMIQGGDPLGIGSGNPGYRFDNEIAPDLQFDKPGLLAMANAGPGTNGSQFFITEGTPMYLNGKHTIFGKCDPLSLVSKITGVERGPRDKPTTDVVMKKVVVTRGKAKKAK